MKSVASRLPSARQAIVFSVALGLVLGAMPSSWAAPPKTKPSVTITDVTRLEGDAGATVFSFGVGLSQAVTTPVSLSYQTTAGTATAGSDFTMKTGTAVIPAGTTRATIDVSVAGDHSVEPNETFTVNFSGGGKAVRVTDPVGLGTIQNDDAAPRISVADVRVSEGDAKAAFTVSLSNASPTPVTVQYGSADGTATSGADYSAVASTLTFSSGDISKNVSVPVLGDALDEDNETFSLGLTNNSRNSTISVGNAIATIDDDDATPQISVEDVTATEGDASAAFTVSLSHPSATPVTVQYASVDGTATSGGDYSAVSSSLTFTSGDVSEIVSVPLLGDVMDEDDETFSLGLTSNSPNSTISVGNATATIGDDDAAPRVSINDVVVTELPAADNTAAFTVSLSQPSGRTVTVDYTTVDGTVSAASSGVDYTPVDASLSFSPGQISRQVDVVVHPDGVSEPDEIFRLSLSDPVNAELGSPSKGTAVIVDDDPIPTVSVSEQSVVEGHAGTQDVRFTVTLSAPVGAPVSAKVATVNETAESPIDYTGVGQNLTFAPGERTGQLVVPVHGDRLGEPNETFKLQVEVLGVGVNVAELTARGTIVDDDKFTTKTTLGVGKSASRVVTKGTVTPPIPSTQMVIKLYKNRRGKWVLVATKRPKLGAAQDLKGDGVLRSSFSARFNRPSGSKYLKAVASYAGNARNLPSKATRRIRYR